MADISELPQEQKKNRVTKFPHGQPRDPELLREIARLRDIEKLKWRKIGPTVGMTAQGACLLYLIWKKRGWFNPEDKQEEQEEQVKQEQDKQDEPA